MKKLVVFLLAIVIAFSTFVGTTGAAAKFTDVSATYWANKEIEYLNGTGVIKGYGNGKFGPDDNVKRVQAAVMISRALKLNLNGRPNPGFKDIPANHYAYKEIAAVVAEGIFPKGAYFYPNQSLTRGDMAIALFEAYNLTGEYTGYVWDVDKNTKVFRAVGTLAANGITKIYEDETFRPNNPVTRAQFSVFFARTMNKSFAVNARLNPANIGKTVVAQLDEHHSNGRLKYEIKLTDVILDGNQSWRMILDENQFNEPAPVGMKYIMAKFKLKALQVQQGSFYVSGYKFSAVSKSGTVYKYASVVTPSPELTGELYTGGESEGWVVFLVKDDDQPTIVWNKGDADELWFTLK